MNKIDTIANIEGSYDHYIFDMSGVLTDGEIIFPKAINCIRSLQTNGKDVIVLSNSPRIPDSIRLKLKNVGLSVEKVVTSGGFMLDDLRNPRYFPNITQKCYKVGDNENAIFEQEDVKFDFTQNIQEAKYILINKFLRDESEFKEVEEDLEKALDLNLPCVCPNPDITVYNGESIIYPQGYIAKKYEEIGGEVFYYGKPFKAVYEYLNELYGIDKSKAIMIGDNILTDIKGALSYGIDSLLITSGNHRSDDVEELVNQHGFEPSYILEYVDY